MRFFAKVSPILQNLANIAVVVGAFYGLWRFLYH